MELPERGFEVEETIDRPRDEVWQAMTAWERAQEWMPGIAVMLPVGYEPIGEGSRIRFRNASGSRWRESTVTTWEPKRRLTLSAWQAGISADYAYTLADANGGTAVRLVAKCRAHGPWSRLVHPLVARLMAWSDRPQLANLKRMVEAG